MIYLFLIIKKGGEGPFLCPRYYEKVSDQAGKVHRLRSLRSSMPAENRHPGYDVEICRDAEKLRGIDLQDKNGERICGEHSAENAEAHRSSALTAKRTPGTFPGGARKSDEAACASYF